MRYLKNNFQIQFAQFKYTYTGRASLVVFVINCAMRLYFENGPQCQEGRNHTIA